MNRILLLLVLCASFTGLSAQQVYNSSGNTNGYKHKKVKGYDPSRLIIGGTLNAAYSGDYANFGIGPTVGYKITDAFSAGVGLGYQFNQFPDFWASPNPVTGEYPVLKENLIYPSVWAKYNVYRNWFIDANIEYNFITVKGHQVIYDTLGNPYNVSSKFTKSVPCLLLGAGVKQPLGGRVSGFLEILYDVLQENYSPYYRQFPVFRAGITTGL